MPTLYLLSGLPCVGKTTFAKHMQTRWEALRLSPDEWHLGLFGQDFEHPYHYQRHDWVEAKLIELAEQCLALGLNVILDLGCWSRQEREIIRERARGVGAASELHYLSCSETEMLQRLATRNQKSDAGSFVLPESAIRQLAAIFEVPTADELLPRDP